VEYARGRGFEVTVGFEDASRADITFMASLARQLKDLGVQRIRFADTVGILTPARTYQAVREIIEASGMEVELHAHNDLGMAVANTIMGAKAGADYLDTTISGLGERAGNCDFLKLIRAARDSFEFQIAGQEARRVHEEVSGLISL
jgi:homocitrate synthase NifV